VHAQQAEGKAQHVDGRVQAQQVEGRAQAQLAEGREQAQQVEGRAQAQQAEGRGEYISTDRTNNMSPCRVVQHPHPNAARPNVYISCKRRDMPTACVVGKVKHANNKPTMHK
jgi:hypothetical protein